MAIVVEGILIVKDTNLTINANYIIVSNGGYLQIGTPEVPIKS